MANVHIVLFEPEIPSNTGNIIRLCHNTGCSLHLIKPYGFELEDKKLRRAGLDYSEWVTVSQWDSFSECFNSLSPTYSIENWFAMTTKGQHTPYQADLSKGCVLVFGPETRGLPLTILEQFVPQNWLKLPMQADSRSLNLSNAVAVGAYEAWRQQAFME